MKAVFTKVHKYHVEAVSAGPVHVGSAEGKKGEILIHPVLGKPFIQGTSLAGVFSDYIKSTEGSAEKWFGSALNGKNLDGRSKITFSDAFFQKESVMVETRPHVRINPETSSVSSGKTYGAPGKSGHKLDITYVSEGSSIVFDVYQFMDADENSDDIVEKCLSAFNRADIRLGGITTTGCGIFRLTDVVFSSYDMRNSEDRDNWADESKAGEKILEKLEARNSKPRFTKIQIDVSAEKLNVKGSYIDTDVLNKYGYDSDKDPDSMPASNPRGEFFIPGSSFKGIFRSHIQSVSDYIGMSDSFMEKTFSNSSKSKIFFRDSVPDSSDVKIHVVARNKIDKFTGGTIDKSLFKEVEISGKFTISADIDTRESELWTGEDIKRAAALMIMTVRDLAVHTFSIGSGASVGRGYADVNTMKIETADGESYSINFKNSSMDEKTKTFVNECLSLLKEEC